MNVQVIHQTQMLMGAEQIKEILHLRIEQADESFLRILHAMTEAYAHEHLEESQITDEMIMAVPANPSLKQLTEKELIARLEESSAQAQNGDYITIDELEKEIKEW